MLKFALNYAREGFYIFPLKPGAKTPLTTHGVKDATRDEGTIKRWWKLWPNANIGVATGSKSGVMIVDLDSSEALLWAGKNLPTSPIRVRTGKGEQWYFKSSPEIKNSVSELAPGVDIRNEGGYGILPPSLNPNGKRYAWISKAPLRDLPDFPKSLCVTAPAVVTYNEPGWISKALEEMKIGNIDNTLVRVLGRLRRDGYAMADAISLLRDAATRAGATAGHLEAKANHIWAAYPQQPEIGEAVQSVGLQEFLEEKEHVEWIVPSLIAKKSIGFVAGLPETLKTWLLLDLAVECCRKIGASTWLRSIPVSPVTVLFIDQERFKGETQRRFAALIAGKGLTSLDLSNLHVKCGSSIKVNNDQSYEAFKQELRDLRPDLVLVDSFATFHTVSENDRMEIQKVLDRIKCLRDEIGCSFVFINHENKLAFDDIRDGQDVNYSRMAGSIGIPAAAETVFVVRKIDENKSIVYHAKSTLGPKQQPFTVEITDTDNGGVRVGVVGNA